MPKLNRLWKTAVRVVGLPVLLFLFVLTIRPVAAAGILVNSDADTTADDGNCTLREAITAANTDTASGATAGECAAGSGADTISFAADAIVTLSSQLPTVVTEMTVIGTGAANTIIQSSTCNPITLPGGCESSDYRVMRVSPAGNLTLERVTVRHGHLGLIIVPEFDGGGILNDGGILTVNDSTFSGNRARAGGGIANIGGTLSVDNSTFSGNYAYSAGHSLMNRDGTAIINNSTFISNSDSNFGAAYYHWSGTATINNSAFTYNASAGIVKWQGTLTVVNSTISKNFNGIFVNDDPGSTTLINNTITGNGDLAYADTGGIHNEAGGGLTLVRNLVAGNNNTEVANASPGVINADANNVFGYGGLTTTQAFSGFTPGTSDINATSDAANIALGDILNTTLANNGGPTQTHMLTPGSPAQDIADSADCAGAPVNGLDQRGEARPRGAGCDAGSVEAPPYIPAYAGGQITFTGTRDGNEEIYVMALDGSNQTNISNNPADDYFSVWSPDMTKIAFTSERDGNGEVYVMDSDGGNPTRLTNDPEWDGLAVWSPDMTKIAFASERDGNSEIYLMNADGSNQTRLTNNPATDSEPSWSPDGTKIAFYSDRDGNDEVYVMDTDGGNQTNLSNDGDDDFYPAWSPDGTQITFTTYRDGNREIYVMDANGGSQTNLTNNADYDSWSRWSTDGTMLVYSSERDGNRQIYAMNADGSDQTNLSNNAGHDAYPNWGMPKEPVPPVIYRSFMPLIVW